MLSSREDSEGNFCFATLGSHVSRPPGKPPRPLPPAFHHFLPPGGHHHLHHWSSSHEITKSQQLSSSPSLHQPHTPAPAGSVGQLVPPEQMVRNAGSSKERRRGAFIMRIQLNPGNGQCGLGKVPGRGGRGRGRCRSLGCLKLRLLSIVYLVRLILKPIRADFRFKIKTASIFLGFPAQSPLHGLPRVRAMSPSKYRPVDVDGRPQEHNKPICRYPHSTQSCVYHPPSGCKSYCIYKIYYSALMFWKTSISFYGYSHCNHSCIAPFFGSDFNSTNWSEKWC